MYTVICIYVYIYIGYINTHTIIYTLWHSSALYLFLGWVPRMHCTLTLGYARSPMPGFLGNAVGGYRQYLLNRNMTNHYTRNYKWLDAADNVVNLCKFTCSVSFICNVLLLKNGNKSWLLFFSFLDFWGSPDFHQCQTSQHCSGACRAFGTRLSGPARTWDWWRSKFVVSQHIFSGTSMMFGIAGGFDIP